MKQTARLLVPIIAAKEIWLAVRLHFKTLLSFVYFL